MIKLEPEAVKQAVLVSDPWAISSPEKYTKVGLSADFVNRFSRVHKSNFNSPKEIIIGNDNEPIAELIGVHNLEILAGMVNELGLVAPSKLGRGSQGREYQKVLLEWCKTQGVS